MFSNLKFDLRRYISQPADKKYLLFEQGLWALVVYRFGRWVRTFNIPVVSFLLKVIAFLWFKSIEISTGISIPASAQIGKGFYIGHFGSIILHSDVIMGENCSIGPGVLIGARGLGKQGVPVIGSNVYIGSGAKVLGAIKIGDNVRIGANSVVIEDVPSGTTVVGIPARRITS